MFTVWYRTNIGFVYGKKSSLPQGWKDKRTPDGEKKYIVIDDMLTMDNAKELVEELRRKDANPQEVAA